MKRYIALLLLFVSFAMSCTKKEATTDACQKGTMKFISRSVYNYDVVVDDKPATTVNKLGTVEHSVFTGTYKVVITQTNGYLVDPKVYEHWITVKGCGTEEIVIPKLDGEK